METRLLPMLVFTLGMTACQSITSPVAPGQLFKGNFVNINAPNSLGWKLMGSSTDGMVFTREGDQSGESYVAMVYLVKLTDLKDRDEFVELVRRRTEERTSSDRFKSTEFKYDYTEARGYPCVKVIGAADDTKARTPSGQDNLKLQSHVLYCRHPRRQGEGFVIDYSYRGSRDDPTLSTQADGFMEGVQVPDR